MLFADDIVLYGDSKEILDGRLKISLRNIWFVLE